MLKIEVAMLFVILILLTGCASFNTGFAAGTEKGAQAADSALDSALWYVCKGASVGAVNRRFGSAPSAYKALCAGAAMGVVGP